MENQSKISLSDAVVSIVAEFASRESATVSDVIALTKQLPSALSMAEQPTLHVVAAANATVQTAIPAVPISQSVTDDAVVCLCCGRSFTMLKRHLKAEHGLTESEYRARFNLDENHPLVAPNYSMRKAEYAKRIGLGKYTRDDMPEQGIRPSA